MIYIVYNNYIYICTYIYVRIYTVYVRIYSVGPLVRHWTMRFEAKHQYIKTLASRMGNYINICYSLAVRQLSYQCYILSSESGVCVTQQVIGRGMYITSYAFI